MYPNPFAHRGRPLLAAGLLGIALVPSRAAARSGDEPAVTDTIPADAYADYGARDLMERARAARGTEARGLDSYEATMSQRIYVGFSAFRFRRERGLFRSEQIARVRWSADGTETYRWLGSRQAVPVLGGDAVSGDEDDGTDPDDLIPLDPAGDRLMFGGEDFLHPLADSAGRHYRFASGDTIRIRLPSSGREVTLVQVLVTPRRADFGLLAGALWFDLGSAALVRGVFRPARDFDLQLDEPEDAAEVPGFLKPVTVTVRHMIVEYALHDLRWWLPWRVRLEGEGKAGRLLRVPAAVELTVSDFALNQADTLDIPDDELPPGWVRRTTERTEDDGRIVHEVSIVPPRADLRGSPLLSHEFFAGESVAFSDAELSRMRADLARVSVPRRPVSPALSRLGNFRFNRVEGLSGGIRREGPVLGSLAGWASARIGIADRVPNAEAGLRRDLASGALEASAYYRLQAANDWGNPLDLEGSINALLLGYDYGEYYRAGGGAIEWREESGRVRHELRAFAETHRAEDKGTDASLASALGRDDPAPNIRADRIDAYGLAARLRFQGGVDPEGWLATATAWGEAATGDMEYARLGAGFTASHPLAERWTASLGLSGGTTWGAVPVQRLYYLGGPQTVRAYDPGPLAGTSFWLSRAELAYGAPGVRGVAFVDLGWVGDRAAFGFSDPAASVGIGASGLDGLVRIDLARSVSGPGPRRWQLHLYLDGLL
ncbi:MAG: BamA/TamA family outer membrane protein [Gemmatimonadota bacterium]